ncbi:MAG: hypothetical protein IKA28_01980 [Tidjanibacter sp.]|nr:hypothetical protein [Tidjanibacter sp.]
MSKERRRRVWQIIGTTLVWMAVVAFFVGAALLRQNNEQARTVERLKVEITDSATHRLLSADQVRADIVAAGLLPTGQSLDSVSLTAINDFVKSNCLVRKAQTFVDYEGTLTVRLTQRHPLLRIITDSGTDVYITAGAHVLPTQGGEPLNLPLVTGDFSLPFPRGFYGDLRAWAKEEKKNSDKNYIFLLKLINFVRLTESRPEVGGNIVQIVATQGADSAHTKGAEPTVELIPRRGNYSVQLGPLEDVEAKLDRWVRFVKAGVVDLGGGGTLNVAYEGQAVWRVEDAKSKTRNSKL